MVGSGCNPGVIWADASRSELPPGFGTGRGSAIIAAIGTFLGKDVNFYTNGSATIATQPIASDNQKFSGKTGINMAG
jgi:hypothetical protein